MHQQHLSPLNENYKASITRLEHKDKDPEFEVIIYRWSEENLDDEGRNLWERLAGPFILDQEEQAYIIAQEQLQLFTGEAPDSKAEAQFKTKVKSIINHENFYFFKPQNFEIQFVKDDISHSLKAQWIMWIDEVYLVGADEACFIGFLSQDRTITCFQKVSDLSTALETIKTV